MAILIPEPRIQFFDNNGEPLVGGKVYTYEAGTTTPKTTWQDEAETVPNTNPVILDSIRGDAIIRGKGSYKINVTDANDVQITGYPIDNITLYDLRDWSGLTATIAELNATNTSTLAKTADYSITLTDRGKTILVDATAATPTTVTLLNATAAGNGYQITIKKTDLTNNLVNIDPATAQKVDGIDPFVLYDYNDFVKVLSDGSNWHLIAAKIRGTVINTTTTPLAPDLGDDLKTYIIDASSGAFTVNLPAINTVARGFKIGFKKLDSSSNAITINGDGSEQIDGGSSVVISKQFDYIILTNDGSDWFVIGEYGSGAEDTLPAGYINGLVAPLDIDTDHDVRIDVGEARDTTDTMNLKLDSNIVKRIDANWVAGTGNGGFPSGLTLTADTWYHVFVIGKTDGTVDAGYDSDVAASNLLTDATGYTGYRRVHSVYVDATLNMRTYAPDALNPNIIYWEGVSLSVDTTSPGNTTITSTLLVPPDVTVYAILGVKISRTSAGNCSMGIRPTTVAIIDEGQYLICHQNIAACAQVHVLTDQTKQINYKVDNSSADTVVKIYTHGWIDPRGKR